MKPMRVWMGGILIVLGVLSLLDAAKVLAADILIGRWWPVAILGLAVLGALTDRRVSLGPVVLFLIGTVLLVDRLELVNAAAVLWPLIAVIAGAWLLLDVGRLRGAQHVSDRQNVFTLFGASQTRNRSQHFEHANVSAVLGGATLDLREARPEPGARVDALALFGGVEVVVPRGWRVALGGLPIFGGYEDKTTGNGALAPDAPVLQVSATAIFGGVDVKNPPD